MLSNIGIKSQFDQKRILDELKQIRIKETSIMSNCPSVQNSYTLFNTKNGGNFINNGVMVQQHQQHQQHTLHHHFTNPNHQHHHQLHQPSSQQSIFNIIRNNNVNNPMANSDLLSFSATPVNNPTSTATPTATTTTTNNNGFLV